MPIRRSNGFLPLLSVLAIGAAAAAAWYSPLYGAESAAVIAPPSVDNPKVPGARQTAVLAGGCFWGVQGVFQYVKGVTRVVAGYSGGSRGTARYEAVSLGNTGHAESVQITFDPAQVSYGELLQIAFSVVYDPTTLNRQGPDVGTQYRSAIFYADAEQKRIAETYIAQLEQSHAFRAPIVTRVDPLTGFFPAENYHQDYLTHNPTAPYIVFNDMPKVENFRRTFPTRYSGSPVLVNAR